jgi:hypothetical protein
VESPAKAKTDWHIAGEEVGNCNCAWGCPCQFNADPTSGRCEALLGWQIQEGYFGDTQLEGVRFARIYSWPGSIPEGNGTRQLIIDEQATPEQREALIALESGEQGGAYFEIFAAVCPNVLETIYAPISLEIDRERRQATLYIPGVGESRTEPIKNPVTGEDHRAKIVLPNGFEYKEAEMGNTAYMHVQSDDRVAFEHENTYAQLNAFDWSNT